MTGYCILLLISLRRGSASFVARAAHGTTRPRVDRDAEEAVCYAVGARGWAGGRGGAGVLRWLYSCCPMVSDAVSIAREATTLGMNAEAATVPP